MLFEKKIKRVVDVEHAEEEFERQMEEEGIEFEKNDRKAMILAALIVFVPAVLFVIGFFLLIIWFFFMRHLP